MPTEKQTLYYETAVRLGGMRKAARELGVNYSTVQTACQAVKLSSQQPPPPQIPAKEPIKNQWLEEIAERFNDEELKAIAKGGRIVPGMEKVPVVSFSGKRIRFGTITDTHIGHKRSPVSRLEQAFDVFHQERVDFITHSGDITEGMSHRPGHIYELDHLGYDAQKDEAVRVFGQWSDTEIYAIDGNHDRWFIKSNGAIIAKDIAAALTNFKFLGHDEGDISLDGKATIKLWHGEDASSYALSYRLQKILESLTGGEKPNIMIAGHTHKYANIFERNVWCVSTGSVQSQTSWMRGKRIAAHVGFCVCDAWVAPEGGVSKFSLTWYPFYA